MRKILFIALIAILVIPLAPAATAQEGTVFRTAGNWAAPPAWQGNSYGPGIDVAWWFIWEPLFHYVPGDDSIVMRLAESYEESADGLTSTVVLREGSTWHDGTPATAQDVWDSFAFEHSWNALVWSFLDEIEIVDDMTLIFHWGKPNPLTRQLLAGIQIRAPHHLYGEWAAAFMEAGDDEEAKNAIWDEVNEFRPENPIGTGPFMIDVVTESQMILAKFEDHPQADNVAFDEVVIERWASNEAVWSLLQAGQVDAAHPSVSPDITEGILASRENMEYVLVSDLAMFAIYFNPDKYDLAAKRAFSKIIDRAQIREISAYYALDASPYASGVLASLEGLWLDDEWMAENLTSIELNPEEGLAELEEMGLAGSSVVVGAPADWGDWILACENLAQQLSNHGFDAVCQPRANAVYENDQDALNYDIDIGWYADFRGTGHPSTSYQTLFGSEHDATWGRKIGASEQPELLEQLGSATTFEEAQPIVRELATIANENLLAIPFLEKRLGIFRAGDTITGWPAADDPIWTMCGGGIERFYVSLMVMGQLQPAE